MKLRSFVSSYLIAVTLVVTSMPAALQAASRIGLYTDETGSTCSFSGNDPGLFTAYVVINPDPNGVQAVRFSAPIPACFGSVFISDTTPGFGAATGQSPTGVQIAFQSCGEYGEPLLALTITYFRNGSTTPCCAFPIEPDPLVGSIEVTNCSFGAETAQPMVSRFNADGSCPCVDSDPPAPPISPGPVDGATNVSMGTGLSWTHNPLETDIASFDVYFGTTANPPFVANVTQDACALPYLNTTTEYHWRVVVRDMTGNTTSGPTWTFTTRAFNTPPNTPVLTNPANGATAATANPLLQWTATDVDEDQLRYDVYLGLSPNPVLVSSNQTASEYQPSGLQYPSPYSWYIVVRDAGGAETTGPTWSFNTPPGNHPPNVPILVAPSNGAAFLFSAINFQWTGGDPDNNLSFYNLYVGTTNPPGLSLTTTATNGQVSGLSYGTQYYWYVVARDAAMVTTTSPVWSFRTNSLPTAASNPSPPDGAQGQPLNTTISWQATDADGDPLTYEVYFGSNFPVLRATGVTANSFDVSEFLGPSRTYKWKIYVWDNHNSWAEGPVWTFSTVNPTAVPELPKELSLGRNHPNPFNPQTIIPYTVPKGTSMHVRIMIFDASGRRVRVLIDEMQSAGAREVVWRGENEAGAVVSSGIYYCVMDAGGKRFTQKLVLLK